MEMSLIPSRRLRTVSTWPNTNDQTTQMAVSPELNTNELNTTQVALPTEPNTNDQTTAADSLDFRSLRNKTANCILTPGARVKQSLLYCKDDKCLYKKNKTNAKGEMGYTIHTGVNAMHAFINELTKAITLAIHTMDINIQTKKHK